MLKPLSQLNYFFRLAAERKLSGSDQLMYLHIFNKFNQAHWTETLRITDAELKDLMRLYDSTGKPATIETIRRSRQRLKAKGFIEFTSGNGQAPLYNLPCLYPDNTPDYTPADTPDNTPDYTLLSSTLLRSKDEEKKEKKTLTDIQSRTRIESGVILNNKREGTEKEESDSIDELIEYWEKAGGSKLNFVIISELKALLEENSLVLLKKAIDEACMGNNSRYGFSLNYMKLKLADIQKAVPALKGGESSGRYQESKDPRATWAYSNS